MKSIARHSVHCAAPSRHGGSFCPKGLLILFLLFPVSGDMKFKAETKVQMDKWSTIRVPVVRIANQHVGRWLIFNTTSLSGAKQHNEDRKMGKNTDMYLSQPPSATEKWIHVSKETQQKRNGKVVLCFRLYATMCVCVCVCVSLKAY